MYQAGVFAKNQNSEVIYCVFVKKSEHLLKVLSIFVSTI